MTTTLRVCGCIALLAVAAAFAIGAYWLAVLPPQVGQDLRARGDALQGEVSAARRDLADSQDRIVAAITSLPPMLDARLASVERDLNGQTGFLLAMADRHLNVLTERADARLKDGIAEIGHLRADLKPVLASTDELLAQTSGTVAVLRPQLLGLSAAAKVTLGETAQAARRLDASLPRFIEKADRIAANSDRTTEASAQLIGNLAKATKPLPTWMRVGLAVSPPLAQVGSSIVTSWAIKQKK